MSNKMDKVSDNTKKYLVALPCFPNSKGFNHRTVLVMAINENEALITAKHFRPTDNIGDIKQVYY